MQPGNLPSLPDELWLHIASYLDAIRSFENQSAAFQNKQKEKARQSENQIRRSALHSLCLVSRNFREISTPILYTSFHACTTWRGIESLTLFHRTISDTTNESNRKRLSAYIRYIENRLSDHLGNNLYDDTACPGAEHMAARFFYLLADVVKLASNLQYLCVVSLETRDISFWRYVAPPAYSPLDDTVHQGLSKLRILSFQTHIEAQTDNNPAFDFYRTCSVFMDISTLTDLRVSGVGTNAIVNLPVPFTSSFNALQRLEITQCMLELEHVLNILLACRELRHIICEWALLSAEGEAASTIYPGLLCHIESLETLHLDMRNVRFFPSVTVIGSLLPFRKLAALTMCETTLGSEFRLVGIPQHEPETRIREQLPDNVKHLGFLVQGTAATDKESVVDEMAVLWRLLDDLNEQPSGLKSIAVCGRVAPLAPKLEAAFSLMGIRLDVVNEDMV